MRRSVPVAVALVLIAFGAIPVATASDTNASVVAGNDSYSSPDAGGASGTGNASLEGVPGLEYRALNGSNGSSMHSGRTTVADFRPSSIAVHDWFSVYNPSNVSFSGNVTISVPGEAEVADVGNGSGGALEYSAGEGAVDLKNFSVPAGRSRLVGVHYDAQGNSLNLTIDRYTEEMTLVMRAPDASQDQFSLSGPIRMQGPTSSRGKPGFVAAAEKVDEGAEFGVEFEPAPASSKGDREEGPPSDIYLAAGVALGMVAVLVYTVKGEFQGLKDVLDSNGGREGGRGQFCPECGSRSDGNFCPSCGAEVEAACPGCGADLEPGVSFCGRCGKQVGGDGPEVGA